MARIPGISLLLAISALFNFAFDGLNSIAGVFVLDKFAAPLWVLGLLFVVVGLAQAIMQATLVRSMLPKYGEKRMAIVSLSGEGLGALAILVTPVLWMLFPVFFLQSLVVSFIFSALSTLAANRVADHQQGQLAGVIVAVNSVVAALGPLWAGLVYDQIDPGSPYWMGAILLGLACLLMLQVKAGAPERRAADGYSGAD
jgi:DHA1 family tetracycline resistance protein-like MFS transporter